MFVSNSSSSASVLITTLANHERALGKLTDYHRAVVNAISEKKQFMGTDLVAVGEYSTMGGSMWEWVKIDWDGNVPLDKYGEEIYAGEVYDEYENEVNKNPSAVLSWSVSW